MVWRLIGIDPHLEEFRLAWLLGRELQLPSAVHTNNAVLLILWHIWKARNALIFDQTSLSATSTLRRVLHDMESWSYRYKKMFHHWRAWIVYFSSRV
jgi:hypothetical protein